MPTKLNSFLYFPPKMAQLVLLSLITAAIGKSEWNLRLDQLRGSAAAHLLQSLPSSALKLQPNSAMDSELFKPTQWAQLRQWLIREQSRGNGPSTSGTLIHWIVQNQAFVLIWSWSTTHLYVFSTLACQPSMIKHLILSHILTLWFTFVGLYVVILNTRDRIFSL